MCMQKISFNNTKKEPKFARICKMEVKREKCRRQLRIDFRGCKLCPYRTKSMFLLIGHLRLHRLRTSEDSFSCHSNPPRNYKCNKCSFEANLKTTLQHHIDAAHCDRIAPKSEETAKTYKCKGCRFETCSLLVFSRHFYSAATGGKCGLFVCYKCSYETTNRSYFKAHSIMKHLQDVKGEWYKCDQCPFASRKKYTLMLHTLREHADPDEGFRCDRCPWRFGTRFQLQRHEATNHDKHTKRGTKITRYECPSLFACEQCKFRVYSHRKLEKHVNACHFDPSRGGKVYKC